MITIICFRLENSLRGISNKSLPYNFLLNKSFFVYLIEKVQRFSIEFIHIYRANCFGAWKLPDQARTMIWIRQNFSNEHQKIKVFGLKFKK